MAATARLLKPTQKGAPLPIAVLRVAVLLITVLAMVSGVTPAFAHELQPPALNVQTFRLQPGLGDGLLLRDASPVPAGKWSLAADLHWTYKALTFQNDQLRATQTVVGDLGMLDLGAVVGVAPRWTATAVLPVAWLLRGGGPNLVQIQTPRAPALGDLRLEGRYHLTATPLLGGTLDAALAATLSLPTGSAQAWLGGTTAVDLFCLASGRFGPWRTDADLGVDLRGNEELRVHAVAADGTLRHDLDQGVLRQGTLGHLRVGVGRDLLDDRLQVRGELQVLAPLTSTLPDGQGVVDLALAGRYRVADAWQIQAFLGGAPTTGFGSAGLHLGAGVRFDPMGLARDEDADGVDDRVDKCLEDKEDRDGFQDQDGCPDLDDDADELPDAADKCPLEPEDRDGFQDADGCPDLDDDSDGLPDATDKCPRAAEDVDGFDDRDGCPDLDDDGDGVPDKDDLCPQQPENRNNFEDVDGCPDSPPQTAPSPPATPTPPAAETAPAAEPTPAAPPAAAPPAKKAGAKPAPVPPPATPAPADKKGTRKVEPIR